tara:strand:+ start:456 stop:899 length:444 start_codon:yes stop_codon:yes gene_type:complete
MTNRIMTPRTFALASLLATGMATGAAAQSQMMPENLVSAEQIEDGSIYAIEVNAEDTTWASGNAYTTIDANWKKVGEISDVLLDQNGQMVAILAEIGGFLDIGDRDVILPLESVRFAMGEGKDYNYVTNLTEAQLNELPEVDEDMWD